MWHSQVARFNCLTRYNLTLFILKIVLKAWIIPKILIFHRNNPFFNEPAINHGSKILYFESEFMKFHDFPSKIPKLDSKPFNFWWKWSFFSTIQFLWWKLLLIFRENHNFPSKMIDFWWENVRFCYQKFSFLTEITRSTAKNKHLCLNKVDLSKVKKFRCR